jgi:hypothetical protein
LLFVIGGQRLKNFQDGFVWKFVFLNHGWTPMNTDFPKRPRRRIFLSAPLACPFGVCQTECASGGTRARAAGRSNRDGRAPKTETPSFHVMSKNDPESVRGRRTRWPTGEDFSRGGYESLVRHYPYFGARAEDGFCEGFGLALMAANVN